jgi:hypothetical protein
VNAAAARRAQDSEDLTQQQRARRDALHGKYMEQRDRAYRDATRHRWHAQYLQFERERQKLLFELDAPQERLRRLLTRDARRVLRFDAEFRTGFLSRVHKAAMVRHEKLAALEKNQKRRRAMVARKFKAARFESVDRIDARYSEQLAGLKELERAEREALREAHTRASEESARRIEEGRDYADYRAEKKQARHERLRKLKEQMARPTSQFQKAGRDASRSGGRGQDGAQERKGKFRAFRDNATDIGKGRDEGRDRSRKRKPPGEPDEP